MIKKIKRFFKKLIRCEKGFTIVELIVVVVILAVLAVFIVPAFVKHTAKLAPKVARIATK